MLMAVGNDRAGFHGCTGSNATMSRLHSPRCQVCKHAERWRIELWRAGGASLDLALAEKFSVDRVMRFWRHWQNHVTTEMKASYLCGPAQLAEKAAAEGDSVLDHLRMIRTVLTGQLARHDTEAGDGRGAAYVAGRLTATLETIARGDRRTWFDGAVHQRHQQPKPS